MPMNGTRLTREPGGCSKSRSNSQPGRAWSKTRRKLEKVHYSNLVVIEKDTLNGPDGKLDVSLLEGAVKSVMGPHEKEGGFWDWYQIGGRWTGTFDGYAPDKDPANIEVCRLCKGTGKRTDIKVESGCNGCAGTGQSVRWPTEWKDHPGDVVPLESVTEEQLQKFYRVVLPDGYGNFACEKYAPWADDKFPKQEMPTLKWLKETFPNHYAVVVDNHC
jgi:hypothetical protein